MDTTHHTRVPKSMKNDFLRMGSPGRQNDPRPRRSILRHTRASQLPYRAQLSGPPSCHIAQKNPGFWGFGGGVVPGRSEGLPRAGYFIPAHVGDGGGVGWGCSAVVAAAAVAGGVGRGHMRKYEEILPIPALGHLPKSRNVFFLRVPKRRRQLGQVEKSL